MIKYQKHSNNYFLGSRARAKREVGPVFYVGNDGSVYEIEKHGLFQKYNQIVAADNEPDYEVCKECGQIHNEIANRTYNNPGLPFTNTQKHNCKCCTICYGDPSKYEKKEKTTVRRKAVRLDLVDTDTFWPTEYGMELTEGHKK